MIPISSMTATQAWSEVLRQWKFVTENLSARLYEEPGMWVVSREREEVEALKRQWCHEHGYKGETRVRGNCVFCAYAQEQLFRHSRVLPGAPGSADEQEAVCRFCPLVVASSGSDCMDRGTHYLDQPREFYAWLLELDVKRRQDIRPSGSTDSSPQTKGEEGDDGVKSCGFERP